LELIALVPPLEYPETDPETKDQTLEDVEYP
jgi:hypothetical protein